MQAGLLMSMSARPLQYEMEPAVGREWGEAGVSSPTAMSWPGTLRRSISKVQHGLLGLFEGIFFKIGEHNILYLSLLA